jgi:hypothetical protein
MGVNGSLPLFLPALLLAGADLERERLLPLLLLLRLEVERVEVVRLALLERELLPLVVLERVPGLVATCKSFFRRRVNGSR